ncbi:MAG: Wzz/FepE/Etk N-terminal domain-containing protein, partial [Actinomycetia bacterium]|nr:Wzz/FepE/Etk N-terminal domain-containing protein [Actinomycetes bacterium]
MTEIQEEEIDLREYINVLLKRKGVIILIFLIAVITAALVSYFYLKPVYEASTILMISKPKYQVELEPKIQTQFTPEISLATYETLIKDREIEEEVIKKLNLGQPPYELTPDNLQGMITIELLTNTNLIKINLQSGDPKLTKDIANVWAELFVEKNKDLYLKESKEAQGFIEDQLKISKQNLSTIEEEIREFNETNKIDAMDKETTVKLEKIMGNESRLADVKIDTEREKAKIEEIRSQMISQEKLISSSNIDRLTEGLKFIEAKDFIEGQLELAKQNLKTKEEELKTFNQESKISLLEKEITSKTNQIVNFNNRLINLKSLIEQEKVMIATAKAQLNEQEKTFILTKSIYDDASLSQMVSEISEEKSLLLKNLKLKSEELNSLYINLEGRIINSEINLETYQTERAQATENIDILKNELEKDKEEFATEKLKLANLEREYKISENVYIMLANKMKEIEIATATPENQQKIARFTNPEYLSLQKQLIESTIMQKTLQAEEKQLKENINEAWKRVETLKQKLAQEKLTQSRLEREYNTAKGVYNVLSQKNEEVKIAVATESGLVKIASLAYEPKGPIKPNKKLNILIAGVLGLFVGI